MTEVWKNIRGYPGYQVSSLGRVRTHNKITYTEAHGFRHWKDRVLKQKVSRRDSCCRVSLWADGKETTVLVHRLVADAFLESNISTNLTVNHKDGNRLNNNVENLEWMSRGDNIRYGFEHNQYPTCQPIMLITADGGFKLFKSLSKASRAIGRCEDYVGSHVRQGNYSAVGIDGKQYKIGIPF